MTDVKVILRADVAGLGKRGDIVEVSKGYARNFLRPRGSGVPGHRRRHVAGKAMRRARDLKDAKDREGAEEIARVLVARTIEITARAGDGGRLFGSVTNSRGGRGRRGADRDRARSQGPPDGGAHQGGRHAPRDRPPPHRCAVPDHRRGRRRLAAAPLTRTCRARPGDTARPVLVSGGVASGMPARMSERPRSVPTMRTASSQALITSFGRIGARLWTTWSPPTGSPRERPRYPRPVVWMPTGLCPQDGGR